MVGCVLMGNEIFLKVANGIGNPKDIGEGNQNCATHILGPKKYLWRQCWVKHRPNIKHQCVTWKRNLKSTSWCRFTFRAQNACADGEYHPGRLLSECHWLWYLIPAFAYIDSWISMAICCGWLYSPKSIVQLQEERSRIKIAMANHAGPNPLLSLMQ